MSQDKFNILLIEDEEDYSDLIVDYFSLKHIEVTTYPNGNNVMDVFKEGITFDCAIIDHSLQGGMDGLEVSKLIRSKGSNIPIFIHTAHDNFSSPNIESEIDAISNTKLITKGSIINLYTAVKEKLIKV